MADDQLMTERGTRVMDENNFSDQTDIDRCVQWMSKFGQGQFENQKNITKVSESQGFVVHRHDLPDSATNVYFESKIPFKAEAFLDIWVNLEYRDQWDPYSKGMKILKGMDYLNTNDDWQFIYQPTNMPKPLQNRYLTYYRKLLKVDHAELGEFFILVVKGVEKEDLEVDVKGKASDSKGFVSYTIVKDLGNGEAQVIVVNMYKELVKMNFVPQFVVNKITASTYPGLIELWMKATKESKKNTPA